MSTQAEHLEIEERRLCSNCVGEPFLNTKIENEGREGICYYCGDESRTFTIGEMADELEAALEEHYYLTPEEPSYIEQLMADAGEYDWERRGELIVDVISGCADLWEETAEDIRSVLYERHFDFESATMSEENPFAREAQYAEREVDDAESQESWLYFEHNLKTQTRYFNRVAEELLRSIFAGINEQRTTDGEPVIIEAGPGRELVTLYRARVFQSTERLIEALIRPDREIGPPPHRAAGSGRMNAHGISVFYGATDAPTALAEVRPPVGSRVVVGGFVLVRPVRLLNVESLRSVNADGSIFDRDYIRRKRHAKFLYWLSQRITMPVMPNDETYNYLPTQVVADFLATEINPPVDGILYPSVQGGAEQLNVVLFHKASRVEEIEVPEGADISASIDLPTDEGPETHYMVTEAVPPEVAPTLPLETPSFPVPIFSYRSYSHEEVDSREVTLRLDIANLQVHHIRRIQINTESYSVLRHRTEKREPDF